MKPFLLLLSMNLFAADFTLNVPTGWKSREADIAGAHMTILEPTAGGDEKILVGSGVALARSIQELSQHAAALTVQLLPGLQLSAAPTIATWQGSPSAQQIYRSPQWAAWNGMALKGDFYFAVLAIGRPPQLETLQKVARTVFDSARFAGLPRNELLERQLIGRWVNSDNRTRNTNVRDKLMYMSNWTVVFAPNLRFHSTKESFVDTQTDVYGGGNVGASNQHSGSYRVFGKTLVAEIEGVGRQLFVVELYPNAQGILLNGQLFTR